MRGWGFARYYEEDTPPPGRRDAYRIGPRQCRMAGSNFREHLTGEVRRTPLLETVQ
jgi:hypothetical protein